MSEEGFDRLEQHLNRFQIEVRTGFAEVRSKIDDVDRRMHVLHDAAMERIADVDRHMHVLHEEAIDRIAATPEYSGPTKTEFAELKDMIEDRLKPLEVAVTRINADGPKGRPS